MADNGEVNIEMTNGGKTKNPPGYGGSHDKEKRNGLVGWFIFEVAIVVAYMLFTKYGTAADAQELNKYYGAYQDVHVMIFVGFGFLMTFLREYTLSSIGLNFLVSAFAIQWSILVTGFLDPLILGHSFHTIQLSITSLIGGDFAAGAVLISMGAVLGKTTPSQLLTMATIEIIFFKINEIIGALSLGAVDMGGSMFVHTFGAYFGLAVSKVITPKSAFDHGSASSCYHSDVFAMIGTVFLWMFWPSFNGALAPSSSQERVIINTVLALTASCISTFALSQAMRKEISMVDVQNATLAGGVAIGSSTDMVVQPGGALFIGLLAGTLSTVGYVHIQPMLESKLGLHDTCGVHNLHGMPGILGGIGGVVSAYLATSSNYPDLDKIFPNRANGYTSTDQAIVQAQALALTLFFAIVGGLFTGVFLKKATKEIDEKGLFRDVVEWEMPDLHVA